MITGHEDVRRPEGSDWAALPDEGHLTGESVVEGAERVDAWLDPLVHANAPRRIGDGRDPPLDQLEVVLDAGADRRDLGHPRVEAVAHRRFGRGRRGTGGQRSRADTPESEPGYEAGQQEESSRAHPAIVTAKCEERVKRR